MRVLVYVSSNEFDGVSRYASQLAKALSAQGCDVEILYPFVSHYTYHSLSTWKSGGVRNFLRKMKYVARELVMLLFLKGMRYVGWQIIKGTKVKAKYYFLFPSRKSVAGFDAIILANNWYQVYDYDWESLANAQVIQIVHHLNDGPSMLPIELEAWRKPFMRIAVSEYTKHSAAIHGVSVDSVIHNGVDFDLFSPGEEWRQDAELAVSLYWGREPRKGFALGVEACELVRQKYPDLKIYVLGGPRSLRSNSDLLALRGKGYIFLPSISDCELVCYLRSSTVFLYPSLMEGFGFPPLEAMACGVAVVTTRVGAVPEYGTHMENIWIAEKTALDLAVGVMTLISDKELRDRIRSNAIKASRRFAWTECAAKLSFTLRSQRAVQTNQSNGDHFS